MLNARQRERQKKKNGEPNTVETNKEKQKAIGLKVMLHGTIRNDDF